MALKTNIAWTDSTFSPWIGCTKIGPGCDNCYAEAANHRFHGSANWGAGAPRRRTSEANWKKPLQWNTAIAKLKGLPGTGDSDINPLAAHRVFCASQADVFDNEINPQWREDLWTLIRSTPHLTWQLVTKRIGNVEKMLPSDWGGGYRNVWLLITIVNQNEAVRDIPKLLKIPAIVHGLSIEPQIEPIDISDWLWGPEKHCAQCPMDVDCECYWFTKKELGLPSIDWVIVGGESAQFGKCRPFHLEWADDLVYQCEAAGIACFVKQVGSKPMLGGKRFIATGKGSDPSEWPEAIRVRKFPEIT